MRYLVTTKADRLPTDHQIIMVDGTVPDWTAKPGDLHWDHHRPDGADSPLRPEAISIRDHRTGGTQYTLGSIPLHPEQHTLDFTQGTFDRLTQIEQEKNPESGTWGGRRTVGGSPWNTPSQLTVEEIITALDGAN